MHGGSRIKAVALLLALAVASAACGGGDDKKESLPGDAASDDSTTTTVPGQAPAGAPGPDGSTAGGGGAGSAAGGGGQASPTTAAPSGGGPTTTARPGSSPPASSSKTAVPGRYTYRRTGSQTSAFGPRSLDGEGTLTVNPANGTDQHSGTTYTDSSNEQTLRHRPGGIDLLYLKIANQAGTFEFRPSPPVLFAPDPLTVGATWSWRITSTNGALTIDASFKVVRNETVTIGGEAVATSVVEGTSQLSGAFTGTLKQTLWGSERYRLIVRSHDVTDITAPAAIHSESESVLTSTKPA